MNYAHFIGITAVFVNRIFPFATQQYKMKNFFYSLFSLFLQSVHSLHNLLSMVRHPMPGR